MTAATVYASQIVDWTKRDYAFIPRDGGLRGSLVAWGKAPRDGEVLALRKDDRAACYRVTDCRYSSSADADVFTLQLEFVPGRTIQHD